MCSGSAPSRPFRQRPGTRTERSRDEWQESSGSLAASVVVPLWPECPLLMELCCGLYRVSQRDSGPWDCTLSEKWASCKCNQQKVILD